MVFDEYFKPVFPSIERMSDDWDDAFNYWYDKQKSLGPAKMEDIELLLKVNDTEEIVLDN